MELITVSIFFLGLVRLFSHKNKRIYIFISSIALFSISALRSPYFGTDTLRYVQLFESFQFINISVFFNNLFDANATDPVFYLLAKIISLIGISAQGWLALLAAFFIFSITKLIKKYSAEPFLSYLILISLGFLSFSFTGLRQGLAMSITLMSFDFLKRDRLLPFTFIIFTAAAFHSSALIFLIAYPLKGMKIGSKYIFGVIIAIVSSIFFGNVIRILIANLAWTDRLSSYSERDVYLSFSGFIIQFFILVFCLFYRKALIKDEKTNHIFLNFIFIGTIFQAYASVVGEFFRLSMYFSIFSIILIPNALLSEKNVKIRIILYLLIVVALISYIFWSSQFSGFTLSFY